MSDKVRKWKDEAASLLRKGKYAKALVLYKKVIGETPDDYSCYNNIGYIHRKLGHKQEAVKIFEELTDLYAEQGFLLKAIATCKVVMDIDPTHKEIQQTSFFISLKWPRSLLCILSLKNCILLFNNIFQTIGLDKGLRIR